MEDAKIYSVICSYNKKSGFIFKVIEISRKIRKDDLLIPVTYSAPNNILKAKTYCNFAGIESAKEVIKEALILEATKRKKFIAFLTNIKN